MKAMVLFSGGVDSTTCLGMAVDKYGAEEVLALSVSYGQKHQKEVEAARKIAAYYGVAWKQLDLSVIFADSNCSLLSGSTQEIPKETYAEQLQETNGSPVSTYVPFRNGLFLASAASMALSNGCEVIYYGAHSDDAAGNAYPDCSDAFNEAMNRAIYLGSGEQLRIEAPFVKWKGRRGKKRTGTGRALCTDMELLRGRRKALRCLRYLPRPCSSICGKRCAGSGTGR